MLRLAAVLLLLAACGDIQEADPVGVGGMPGAGTGGALAVGTGGAHVSGVGGSPAACDASCQAGMWTQYTDAAAIYQAAEDKAQKKYNDAVSAGHAACSADHTTPAEVLSCWANVDAAASAQRSADEAKVTPLLKDAERLYLAYSTMMQAQGLTPMARITPEIAL